MIRGARNGTLVRALSIGGNPTSLVVGKRKLGRHVYYTVEIVTNPVGHSRAGRIYEVRPQWLERIRG